MDSDDGAPPTRQGLFGAIAPFALTAATLPVLVVAAGGQRRFEQLVQLGGEGTTWVLRVGSIATVLVAAVMFLVVRGARIPAVAGVAFASTPWFAAFHVAGKAVALTERSVPAVADPAFRAMLASHGALESAAPLWIGASLTASLDLAVALSLAVAALGAPGPRRVARRTVAVATTPVIIAAVASLAYGHTGALGVAFVVAAFGAAVASIAAGAAPADAPGIFAAPFVAALAIYAFCAADLSGAHATLLHALDLAGSVSQRQDLLTASARPFGAWTTLEHLAPLFALAPMAALAVVTRPLPRGTATVANGVALTALAIALVAFDHHQAARVQVCVNSAMSLARGH